MLPYLETVRRRPEHPGSRVSATQGVTIAPDSVVNRGARVECPLVHVAQLCDLRPVQIFQTGWVVEEDGQNVTIPTALPYNNGSNIESVQQGPGMDPVGTVEKYNRSESARRSPDF